MSDKLDQNEAEAAAARVLKDHGQSSPPIDPFAIANDAHIHVCVMETQEPGVAGCLIRVGNEFGIQYSRSLPNEGFIRFTVAHEPGHYFIPGHAEYLFAKGNGIHMSRGEFASSDRLERQLLLRKLAPHASGSVQQGHVAGGPWLGWRHSGLRTCSGPLLPLLQSTMLGIPTHRSRSS